MRLLPLCIIFASVAITVIGHGTFLLGDQHDFPISFAHIGTYLSGLPANTTLPQRVHISLGANASSMIISYVHNDLLWAYPTGVYYGTSPCNNNPNCTYESSAPGNFHSYYYQAGMFVDAVLSDLEPDTLYYYKVGNNHSGFSNETTFQTPPLKTPPQFSFAVYGDMGVLYSNGTIELLQDLVESDDIVGVLHVGDISYADDRMPYQYEEIWDLFFDRIEPISSRVPYMVCPGNHEYPYNYTVFKQRFMMPGLLEGSNSYTGTNMYHSFDYANVHFVAVSTEPSPYFSSQGTQQYTWLEKDLSNAADRKNSGEIDWIVVFGHKPLYCTFNWSDCCGNCNQTEFSPTWDTGATSQQLRSSFEQLLIQYSVDLYVAGHVHSYERMFPLDNWVWQEMEDPNVYLSPKFPVHIVAGSAGCIETVPDPFPMNWTSPATVSRLEDYGFGKLTFYGATELLWQFIGSNTTNYGEVLDEFKIVRQ